MTINDHHLLCLGLLAKIGIQARSQNDPTSLPHPDLIAIRQAIASGQNLGLPIDVKEYDAGRPIHRNAKLMKLWKEERPAVDPPSVPNPLNP